MISQQIGTDILLISFALVELWIPSSTLGADQVIQLQPGFNFPAVCVQNELSSRDLLEAYSGITSIFRFHTGEQAFRFQLRLPDGGLFGDSAPLNPGSGCAINCSKACSVTVSGEAMNFDRVILESGV